MHTFFRLLCGLLLLTLAGCVSVGELKQELNNRQSVATSLDQLDYRPLASEVPLSIKMNEQQAYLFPSGKSFAAGLAVPDVKNPHKLEISTYLTSSYIPSASVFVPRFLFLDAQKQIVGELGKIPADPGERLLERRLFPCQRRDSRVYILRRDVYR